MPGLRGSSYSPISGGGASVGPGRWEWTSNRETSVGRSTIRLIAAKTDEVLRANGHSVAVVVRQGLDEELNDLVRSLLLSR